MVVPRLADPVPTIRMNRAYEVATSRHPFHSQTGQTKPRARRPSFVAGHKRPANHNTERRRRMQHRCIFLDFWLCWLALAAARFAPMRSHAFSACVRESKDTGGVVESHERRRRKMEYCRTVEVSAMTNSLVLKKSASLPLIRARQTADNLNMLIVRRTRRWSTTIRIQRRCSRRRTAKSSGVSASAAHLSSAASSPVTVKRE